MQETKVGSLSQEDPLEKEMVAHSSILARKIPWTVQSMGSQSQTRLSNFSWIIEKEREFQKNIDFCFIYYAKAFDCAYHSKL